MKLIDAFIPASVKIISFFLQSTSISTAVAQLTLLTLHWILLSTGFRNWPVLISSPFKRRSVFFFSRRSTPSEISSVNTTSPQQFPVRKLLIITHFDNVSRKLTRARTWKACSHQSAFPFDRQPLPGYPTISLFQSCLSLTFCFPRYISKTPF